MSRSSSRSQSLLARLAALGVLGGLVDRGGEVRVAEPAAPRLRDHDLLPDRDQVREQRPGLAVEDGRARRDREVQVLAGLAVPLLALAATAGRRVEVVLEAEVVERGLPGVDAEVDRAAAAAVAAVGTAAGDVGLAPHRRRAVAARAGAHEDPDIIEEHRVDCRTGPARPVAAGGRWVRA